MRVRTTMVGVLGWLAVAALPAQEREDRTLLSHDQMRAIVNEASGERALHTVLELVPYPRVRPASEYQGAFRESDVMARRAKEYGFTNVRIESFPSGPQWQPSVGELWITAPVSRKLYDIHDVALALGQGTPSGDVSGELIDVGVGRAADLDGKDLAGKVLLSSSGLGAFAQAAAKGAVGIIGYTALRPNDYPDQIPDTRFTPPQGVDRPTFGWAVEPRVGRDLALRLGRGEKITIRSLVKAEMVPSKAEVVHAEIAGDGSTTQEVAVSGHLYEGVIKQGANDDNSGCALTLEIGRAYIKLVSQGQLPRPKRTINFQWGAEISGTRAWLDAHPEKQKVIIGDLNFDMEGIRIALSRSYWILQRTPDTFPSYINDVAQSMMEWVSDVSRERVRYRAQGYAPSLEVVAPTGSRDAFYIKIDKHYGSSDHVTYMQYGIPSVMFITWPDMWYHSSQDTPDKQDPTQYKRAAVVGIGAMTALATGTDAMAGRVTSENLGRGAARLGDAMRKASSYLADAGDAAALVRAYRDARVTVRHQAGVEKGVLRSSAVLYDDPAAAIKRMGTLEAAIDKTLAARYDELGSLYAVHAPRVQAPAIPAGEPALTPAEQKASTLLVQCVSVATRSGCTTAGGRGGGRGGGGAAAGPALPQHMNAELAILLGQGKTVLEIRDFLSGEFEPIPVEDVLAVLEARQAAGTIKLAVRTPAAPRR